MRLLVAVAMTFVLLACRPTLPNNGQSRPHKAPTNSTVDFLLNSAATDFRTQRPPHPVRFRNVRSGYLITSEGVRQYRLCGEFLPADHGGEEADWIAFTTIKTSQYEQWVGESALSFCEDSTMTWDREELSSSLLSRFNALP